MAILLEAPYSYFADDNGAPLSGGLVYTYVAGTTTPKATYTDSTEITPASNPVVLDSAGRAAIWYTGTYRIDVKTSAGVLIRTSDNVTAPTIGGDMLKATYDPANIAQQFVGTTAVQTITNKTLTTPTITQGNLVGTTTNDNAAAGSVGEYTAAQVLIGAATPLVTTVAKTVTSISLTAGDWDVSGTVQYTSGGTTTSTLMDAIIGLTTNSAVAAGVGGYSRLNAAGSLGTNPGHFLPVGQVRVSVAATTTVYLIANSTFATSTMSAYGEMRARRVR